MGFKGTEGEIITLTEASDWTATYRAQMATGDPKGHFFGKDILNDLLAQSGCMGIRIYYGIDDEEQKVLILVGADANTDDMTDKVADKSIPCPTICGTANALNS
jgi:hypothetical protein